MIESTSLLPYTRFMVSAWSNEPIKNIRVGYDKDADTLYQIPKYRDNKYALVYIPNVNKVYPKMPDQERFRYFRKSVWHEAMHVSFKTPQFHAMDQGKEGWKNFIFQITEDYKIETKGLVDWPGMVFELAFWRAYHISIYEPKSAMDEYYMVFKLRSQPLGFLTKKEIESITTILNDYTDGKIDLLTAINRQYAILLPYLAEPYKDSDSIERSVYATMGQKTAKERNAILNKVEENYEKQLGKYMDDPALANFIMQYSESMQNTSNNKDAGTKDKLSTAIMNYENSFNKKLQEDIDSIKQQARQEEQIDRTSLNGLAHNQRRYDFRPYYDAVLINRLKSLLQHLKRGYVEIPHTEGEFDIESYLNKQKPFIDYQWIGKKYKLTIALDCSGSIGSWMPDYKKAIICLIEVLKYFGMQFELITFPRPAPRDVIYNEPAILKAFTEPPSNVVLERVAGLYSDGDTPLGVTLGTIQERIPLYKPDIIIVFSDGIASDVEDAKKYSVALHKRGIKIYGIAFNSYDAIKQYTWDNAISITHIGDLPIALLRLLFS